MIGRSGAGWKRAGRAASATLAMALLMAIAPLGNAPRAVAAPAGSPIPDDRYVMAGGCYAVRSLALGRYLSRAAGGVAATAATRTGAEPFHFQATALGSYLLYGTAQDFVAAKEGAAGDLARSLTETTAGGILGGLSGGATDAAADALAQRPAGSATGRGSSVVLAADASELADWEITRVARQSFRLRLPATGQTLVTTADGNVALGQSDAAGPPAQFRFEPVNGCARFPEAEVNVTGPVAHGATGFEEVRGYLEGHSHPMAFEFLGGMARCGRPWHAYGITRALVDCPDHEPGGRGAVLEQVVSGGTPGESHDTVGWPTFGYWPNPDSLTHEQVYYKWLERAWRGGLRLYVSLLVDNHVLCEVYPYRRNSCDEMDGVRLQAQRIRELQDYIDAQSGGPGKGWFRIVTDPFEARQIVNQGKLAVVLGIEVSSPLGCEVINDEPQCDEPEIDRQLDAVYDLGVRQMELTNKFDNALTGVTGDGGSTGVVVNGGNFLQTGRFWQFDTCEEDAGDSTDNRQYNLHDETGAPGTDRDGIFGAILRMAGTTGAAPVYGPGPHCNVRGLSDLGKHAIRHMASKGMIFDPDHMSARARQQALDLVESMHYSGIISSHGWADDDIYRRVIKAGGVVTPHAGNSTSFVQKWLKQRSWADPRYLFGIGYGADTNGFSHQGGPRGADVKNPVRYPFTGLGGVVIDRQVSGERIYDINVDGVAHYGLYPDWIEDLRMQAGDEIVRDLERGAEAYLQTWERGVGIAPNACRTDVPDLSDTQIRRLRRGMTPVQVLQALGQPDQRSGTTFGYCATGGRRATVEFTNGGRLVTVRFS